MPRAKISSVERRKAEVAGGVVLMVLRALPEVEPPNCCGS